MLPTTGYFKNFSCPFYESCICERPYCHYRHNKQDPQQDVNVISDLVSKAVHKVLSSTTSQGKTADKDTDTKRITYNPTPIATLNKYKSNSPGHAEKRVKRNHMPYSPEQPAKLAKIEETHLQYDVGDYVNTSVGYSPTPKSTPVQYIPSAIESLYQNHSDSEKNGLNQSYEPVKLNSADNLNLDIKYNPTNNDELTLNEDTSNDYVPNYNDDFIDKFLSDPNIYEPTEISPTKSDKGVKSVDKSSKSDKSSKKYSKSDEKRSKHDSKTSTTVKSSKSDHKTSKNSVKSDSKHETAKKDSKSDKTHETTAKKDTKSDKTHESTTKKDSKSDKTHETTKKDSKSDKTHETTKKDSKSDKTHETTKKDSKSDKTHETTKRDSKSDKTHEATAKKDSKSDKTNETAKNGSKSDKHSETDSKSQETTAKIDRSRDKSRRSSSSGSKDRSRSKSEKKSSSQSDKRSSEHRKKEETKHSSSSSKQNGKSSHEQNGKSSSSHRSSKDRDKSRHRSSSSKDKPKIVPEPEVDPNFDILSDVFFDDEDMSDGEIDKNTLEQCKKIFDEYEAAPVAEPSQKVAQPPVKEEDAQSTLARKRTAHEGSSNVIRPKVSKPNPIRTPGMVMAARYKSMAIAQETQNMNATSVNARNEPGTSKEPQSNVYRQATMNVRKSIQAPIDCNQLPGRNSRIAHVPNVSSLINAKKKISEIKKVPETSKTLMHTVAKGSKRIAHTSEPCSSADTPPVLQCEKSKLAVNVRSKFLRMLIVECMKIYHNQEAANQRGLSEELTCYLKCSALNTYRNSCMLSISRLRKEGEGNGSGDSQPSGDESEFIGLKFYENLFRWILTEEQLVDNGYPRYPAPKKGFAVIKITKPIEKVREGYELCVRCKKTFPVNENGFPTYPEDCVYHPSSRFVARGEAKYMCCRETSAAVGCCVCSTHVYETRDPNLLSGFVRTFDPEDPDDPKSTLIFALDCEMVYTTRGFELARVTIIKPNHEVIYDSMVKPLGHILDANTRFSGLTTEMLNTVSTRITDVQAALLLLFNSKTILIGHSLESDLKALRLIHNSVIDTAVLFPHKMGPPKKRGLRTLASDFLKKIIQNSESGHDSAEDAITCMELVVWRLKEELKTR